MSRASLKATLKHPTDNVLKQHMTRSMTFAEVRELLDKHGLIYESKSIYRYLQRRVDLGVMTKQGEHKHRRWQWRESL